jgi:hypothetical protein
MQCHRCDSPADAEFNVKAFAKADAVNDYFLVYFCSTQCAAVPFDATAASRYDVFECPGCSRYIMARSVTTDEPNWFWSPEDDGDLIDYSCCKLCYANRILQHGHVVTWNFGEEGPYRLDRWVTNVQALDAGYTLVATIAHGSIQLRVAMGVLIKRAEARVVVVALSRDSPAWNMYAKPNGKRALAAARLICGAHRFCKGSALARLPRDMVRFLAEAVMNTCFDLEWLYLQ